LVPRPHAARSEPTPSPPPFAALHRHRGVIPTGRPRAGPLRGLPSRWSARARGHLSLY
jgi:hypothetical protein